MFGAKASQDLFDETIQKIFDDIPWCIKQRDDITIGVHDWAKHNATLEEVLQWMEDFGITLNLHKCELELKFYGYRFSENELIPTPDKVRGVKECTEPKSKMAVWSFPGMTGYLAKFIPRYASLTKSPRDLTHKETKFHWDRMSKRHLRNWKKAFPMKTQSHSSTQALFNKATASCLFTKKSGLWIWARSRFWIEKNTNQERMKQTHSISYHDTPSQKWEKTPQRKSSRPLSPRWNPL